MKTITFISALLYFNFASAAIVDGNFSDWYYSGNNSVSTDFYFGSIRFDGSERDIFRNGTTATCHDTYHCQLELLSTCVGCTITYYEKHYFLGRYTVSELNQKIAGYLPFIGTVSQRVNDKRRCNILSFGTGYNSIELANTCTGTGPVPPPIPEIPLTCHIDGLSSGVVDFGTVSVESLRKSLKVSLSCKGEANASAQLKIHGMDPSQESIAILKKPASSSAIKIRLSIGDRNSNTETISVRGGWSSSRQIHFSLDGAELKGKTGHYTGNAILRFDVL